MKERFKALLRSAGRKGTKALIDALEAGGFFDAPASSSPTKHNCGREGLLEHSLNVCDLALAAGEAKYRTMEKSVPGALKHWEELKPSVIIAALLHDVGKMGIDGQPFYTPNLLKTGKVSTSKPYEVNKKIIESHEFLSVINILESGFNLTAQERRAILYHNGLYGEYKYVIPGKADNDELYLLITDADMTASRVLENPSWLDDSDTEDDLSSEDNTNF